MLAREQTDPEARKLFVGSLITRARQFDDLLTSAQYNMDYAARSREGHRVEAHRIESDALRSRQLGAPPGGHQYGVRLPHAYLYFPVEAEARPTWRQRWFGRKDAQALEVLDLKVALIQELVAKNRPVLRELIAELERESPKMAAAQILTSRLVVNTKAKDDEFVARYASLRAAKN